MEDSVNKSEAQKLLDRIIQSSLGVEDQTPEGYYEVNGWIKIWGYSRTRTRNFLDVGVKNKLIEVIKLRKFVNGKIRHIKYYKEIK